MIQPITIPGGDLRNFYKENRGEHFVYCEGHLMSYHALISLTDGGIFPELDVYVYWRIDYYEDGDMDFSISKNKGYPLCVTKEEFLLHLRDNYPQHFEWMIWNLEKIS